MKPAMLTHRATRSTLAGLAGGIAWALGIGLFFGPAQAILGDPELQSAKFIAAFTEQPLPRSAETPAVLGGRDGPRGPGHRGGGAGAASAGGDSRSI